MKVHLLMISIVVGALSLTVTAQNKDKAAAAAFTAILEMPTIAGKPEGFVPRDWSLVSAQKADFNRDGITDYVIELEVSEDAAERLLRDGPVRLGSPDILLIVFGERGGRLRRVALNSQLIPTFEFSNTHATRVAKDILIVNTDCSSLDDANNATFRYRWETAYGDMMLIGFDFKYYSRSTPDNSVTTSENYLTGVRVITTSNADKRSGAKATSPSIKVVRKQFKPTRVALQDTFLNREGGYIKVRPF